MHTLSNDLTSSFHSYEKNDVKLENVKQHVSTGVHVYDQPLWKVGICKFQTVTESGVGKGKRSIQVCHNRRKCSMETSRN